MLREYMVDFYKKMYLSVNSLDLNAYEDLGAILEQTTVRTGICISERLCINAETPVLLEIGRFVKNCSLHTCMSKAVE